VHAFAASITLFLTILLSLCFGILAGYAAIWGILRLFGQRSRLEQKPARTAEQAGD
jgi:hypothetical protein